MVGSTCELLHLLVNAVECGVLADVAPKNDVRVDGASCAAHFSVA